MDADRFDRRADRLAGGSSSRETPAAGMNQRLGLLAGSGAQGSVLTGGTAQGGAALGTAAIAGADAIGTISNADTTSPSNSRVDARGVPTAGHGRFGDNAPTAGRP